MIVSLTGKSERILADRAVIELGGIGYEVWLPASETKKIKPGQTVKLQIYEHIREDVHQLFGFSSEDARELFVSLLGVNGVGPKVALAIMSAAEPDQLRRAVVSGDPELFRGVAGVGKKTAERIVMELKGKLAGLEGAVPTATGTDETFQALVGLGYPAAQAAAAIAKLPVEITNEQERIKLALKGLSQ